jgi:small subunit ribosomal protein S12
VPTLNQLFKRQRFSVFLAKHRRRVRATKALGQRPQRRGTCLKVSIVKPKKPNSAQRKVARISFTSTLNITAAIPGIGHNVQQFSVVLVRGGHVRDIPGIRYKIIRGACDVSPVDKRLRGRSKYGVKKWKKPEKKKN